MGSINIKNGKENKYLPTKTINSANIIEDKINVVLITFEIFLLDVLINQLRKIQKMTKITSVKIKDKFNFKQSAKDILITSQLRTALIVNEKIKATNYQIDTYKKKIYVYGIAVTSDEKNEVIKEAKEILDVEDVIASILLVENLRIQKN